MEEEGPTSAPASLLPLRCSLRFPSPLVHLCHSAAHRPRSLAQAPLPATAPATVRAATAPSLLRELPSQGPPRLDAASGTSGPDLILATGSKARCELVFWKTNYAGLKATVLIKPWFNWLNICEPTSGKLLNHMHIPEDYKLPLACLLFKDGSWKTPLGQTGMSSNIKDRWQSLQATLLFAGLPQYWRRSKTKIGGTLFALGNDGSCCLGDCDAKN